MNQLDISINEQLLALEITGSDSLNLTIGETPVPVLAVEISAAYTAISEESADAPDFLLLYQIAKL